MCARRDDRCPARPVREWWVACLPILLAASALTAAEPPSQPKLPASELAARNQALAATLLPLIEAHAGEVGCAVKDLTTGVSFSYRGEVPMPTASLIKFPLMVAAFEAVHAGRLSLDDSVPLSEEDKVPGSGILTPHFSAGIRLPLRDLLRLMMVYSDNTATNLVVDQVGLAEVSRVMDALHCPQTRLNSKTYRRETSIDPARSQQFGLGSTTANDMVSLLENLERGQLVHVDASQQMRALMEACEDSTKIARHLRPKMRVANKSGEVTATRTDAALVQAPSGPIAICVLTTNNDDRRWDADNAAHLLCAEIGRRAVEFFAPADVADSAPTTRLSVGAAGKIVEALQRTLNARGEPSPSLNVDGDFGPATEAAVVQFQRSAGLAATGEVDAETWAALGALITEDEPVPTPEVVNEQILPRAAADALEGMPIVTCHSWVVGDAATGECVGGEAADEPRDPASTTKIMTAYLVVSLAAAEPGILDETVTFSDRADQIIGSTCGLMAGEQTSVRELLFGLLLPSGNDASVALAEHFGGRVKPSGFTRDRGPASVADGSVADGGGATAIAATEVASDYDEFVQAMNEMAVVLGLQHTHYKNTHGLTAEGHATTARDLFLLARQAMQHPLFAECVRTRQRGCQVTGPGGYKRNVVWKNTNRLLGIEGYHGVKTGTTNAAGACLVSATRRGDRDLIAVVLGSSGSDARYADTRNLYRWAWRQLEEPAAGQ